MIDNVVDDWLLSTWSLVIVDYWLWSWSSLIIIMILVNIKYYNDWYYCFYDLYSHPIAVCSCSWLAILWTIDFHYHHYQHGQLVIIDHNYDHGHNWLSLKSWFLLIIIMIMVIIDHHYDQGKHRYSCLWFLSAAVHDWQCRGRLADCYDLAANDAGLDFAKA